MKRILILASLLILTACTSATESPAPTASPSSTLTVTLTSSPTATSTPTVTPSPTVSPFPTNIPAATRIYPTPDFFQLPIVDNLLFSPPDSDCQLPCWQGLRIGESNKDDIQAMFDDVFGFNGTREFFLGESELAPVWRPEVPSTQIDGYEWESPEGGHFVIATAIDSSTNTLKGLHFIYGAFDVYDLHTPQQIISRLGIPDDYYSMNIGGTKYLEIGDEVFIDIMMFYNEGMAFHLSSSAVVQEQDSSNEKVIRYCLNSAPLTGRSYIVEPFDSLEPSDLNPLQEDWFSVYYTHWHVGEEEVGLTPKEFAAVVFQDPPCVDLK